MKLVRALKSRGVRRKAQNAAAAWVLVAQAHQEFNRLAQELIPLLEEIVEIADNALDAFSLRGQTVEIEGQKTLLKSPLQEGAETTKELLEALKKTDHQHRQHVDEAKKQVAFWMFIMEKQDAEISPKLMKQAQKTAKKIAKDVNQSVENMKQEITDRKAALEIARKARELMSGLGAPSSNVPT